MPDLVIIDIKTRTEVIRFSITGNQPVPRRGNHIWVPENGDVAYWVHNIEHDYDKDEYRVMCVKEPSKNRI